MNEATIERYLVKRAKEAGAEVRKVAWPGRRGAPDRVVMGRHKVGAAGWLIWVELKAPGEKPEPHQAREHARMRAMGQRVEVVDSLEGVDDLFGPRLHLIS